MGPQATMWDPFRAYPYIGARTLRRIVEAVQFMSLRGGLPIFGMKAYF